MRNSCPSETCGKSTKQLIGCANRSCLCKWVLFVQYILFIPVQRQWNLQFITHILRILLCGYTQCNQKFHAGQSLLKTLENLQLVPSVGYCYAAVPRGLLTNLTSKTSPTSFTVPASNHHWPELISLKIDFYQPHYSKKVNEYSNHEYFVPSLVSWHQHAFRSARVYKDSLHSCLQAAGGLDSTAAYGSFLSLADIVL